MRRRDFFRYGAGAAAGAFAGALAGRSADAAPSGHGHHPTAAGDPTLAEFSYRGRRVVIRGRSDRAEMILDGRVLPHHVFMREDNGSFHSHMLPFSEWRNGRQLAEALIDAHAMRLVVL